jgi:VWFA-related protein
MTTRARLLYTLLLGCLAFLFSAQPAAQQPANSEDVPLKLKVNVNRVLVPVVVRDKQGRTVGDLKQENFQVFDNDKPRTISEFTVEKCGGPDANAAGSSESAAPPASPDTAAQSSVLPDRIIVFLFDDMHMSFEDLAYVRKASINVLAGVLSGSNMAAVVSTSGKVNSGLTRDPAKLQQAIMGLSPRPSDNSDCPLIDYYQADLMVNKHDAEANADALAQVLNCDPGINPQTDLPVAQRLAEAAARRALSISNQDVQATFATTMGIVRRMAKLPGQRTLILVSSGFLAIEQEPKTQESRLIDLAAQSNITISALDARGLFTTALVASDDTHVVPVHSRNEFRASALRANENVMAELSDGTGGTFFHNSNDLNAGFRSLTEAPETIYLLELSLDRVKPDSRYHRLKVKVTREGLDLQARRGYIAPKPDEHNK